MAHHRMRQFISSSLLFLFFLLVGGRCAISLILREAIELALAGNHQILNSRDSLKTTQLNLELTSKALFTPQISLNLSPYERTWKRESSRSLSELQITGSVNLSSGTQLSAHHGGGYIHEDGRYVDYYGFQLTQPLFQDVKLTSPALQVYNAELSVRKSRLKLTQVERELVINIVRDFLDLSELKDSVNLAKERLRQSQRESDKIGQLVKLGTAGELELLSTKINLESGKRQLNILEDELSLTTDEFCHCLGVKENNSLSLVYPEIQEEKLMEKAKELLKRDIDEEIIASNKDVKEAQWAVEQGELQLKQKQQALSPTFSITLGYTSKNELKETKEPEEWKGSLGLTYQLFDGGQRRLRERTAQSQLETARRNLEDARESTRLAILSKRDALRKALSQVKLFNLKQDEVQLQEQLREKQFQLKLISSDQLRDFQIEKIASENDYRVSIHSLLISYLSYIQALGMDLEIDEVISR